MQSLKFILLLILFLSFSFANTNDENKALDALFNNLMSKKEWIFEEKINDISISKKVILGKDLVALKVEKEISILPKYIQDVILDVENYNEFLLSAKSMDSKELAKGKDWLDAYQYIPIDAPFLSDREYSFRISSKKIHKKDSISIVHWFLLDEHKYKIKKDPKKDVIYLDDGAGLWISEKKENNNILLSYILYMDLEGSMPNFIIDKINKVSLINIFKDILSEAAKRSLKQKKG